MRTDPFLRHSIHYKNVLQDLNTLYHSGGRAQALALSLFEIDEGNIEAARRWAQEHSDCDKEAATLCASYPRVGALILNLSLVPERRMEWLTAALRSATQLGDREAEGRLLGDLATAHAAHGDYQRAANCHEQCLEIARQVR